MEFPGLTMLIERERETSMGRKKKGPGPTESGINVRIEASLVDMARHVAAARGTSLSEVMSDLLRAPVEAAFYEVVKELERRVKESKTGTRRSGRMDPDRS